MTVEDEDNSDVDLDGFTGVERFVRCNFDRSVLRNAACVESTFEDCTFRGALLGSAVFVRCRFVRCDFTDSIGAADYFDCTFEDTVKPAAA